MGDDQVSWGVDGIRLKKWAGGDTPYRTARKWRDGDVIGCAADLARGDLSFALNGVWSGPDGVAFRGITMPENGLAPAVIRRTGRRASGATATSSGARRTWRAATSPSR